MISVAGVVLAAGLSSRMGRSKAGLTIGDETFLDRAIALFADLGIDAVGAVVAPDGPRPSIPGVDVIVNPSPERGSVTSLLAAAAAFPGHWLVYLPVDLPQVERNIVDAVIRVTRAIEPWALVTEYADGIGHPFAVSPHLLSSVAGAEGDKVIWQLIGSQPEKVARAHFTDRRRSVDINTEDDYRDLIGA